ncbi:MAG: radical SAM family heme chaperone HemW [Paludibacteraceae bacterium]|nr:radical SAM family heme chaperone HemW [Paludibacteraceae bacterium]
MSGLYIHIPFCKKKCYYCDFYSTANLKLTVPLTDAICREIQLRHDYTDKRIETIYFGGGTPSLLNGDELSRILQTARQTLDTSSCTEQTIEANPDDISMAYAEMLLENGFNRISVGVQSFDDEELRNINRRHTARQAIEAINILKAAGFKNISIDLMFGLPMQTLESWKNNLNTATSLCVQHISAYSLSYEENTVLWQKLKRKEILPVEEDTSLRMFETLVETLAKDGFEHYEISNFARKGFRSKHNANYWNGTPYWGIGPSAHSFDGTSRQWNIRNTAQYIKLVNENGMHFEREQLTIEEQYNDFVITGLRTCEGIDTEELRTRFGEKLYTHFTKNAFPWIKSGKMSCENGRAQLRNNGIFISDTIFSDLIFV